MNLLHNYFEKVTIKQLVTVNVLTLIGCIIVFFGVFLTNSNFDNLIKSNDLLAKVNKNIKEDIIPEVEPTPEVTPKPTPTPTPSPIEISIPDLKLKAKVVEIGFNDKTKEIEVPENAAEVGWYRYGDPPGVDGTSMLTAHYDTPGGRPAIFYNLDQMKLGDKFTIRTDQGQELLYKVQKIKNFPLATFPKEEIFGKRDFSQVTLMTCSGVFSRQTGLYSHRLAVIAKLANISKYDLLADANTDNDPEQFVVQGFEEKTQQSKTNLKGSYIRLEPEQGKISVYLSSYNQDVIEMDTTIRYDTQYLNIDPNLVVFNNDFEVYLANQDQPGVIYLSAFTDPSRGQKTAFNSGTNEVKIAEVYYTVLSHQLPGTYVDVVVNDPIVPSSIVLSPKTGQDLHFSDDILDFVEGATIKP